MNKVILTGNLGKDPELRFTASGVAVCNFTIAVKQNFKNANGEYGTDWFNIVVWRKLAEVCHQHLQKGSKIMVEGRLQSRKYTGNDNITRYVTEVVAENIEFLSNKNTNNNKPPQDEEPPQPQDEFDTGFGSEDDVPF